MSKTLHYQQLHLLSKLHDELVAAGITPERVEGRGEDIWLTVSDSQSEPPVAAVVTAHTDTAPPPKQGAALINDLRQALANWDTLTAAQKDGVLRRCARGVVGLAVLIQGQDA